MVPALRPLAARSRAADERERRHRPHDRRPEHNAVVGSSALPASNGEKPATTCNCRAVRKKKSKRP
jgi:hypothetical protein